MRLLTCHIENFGKFSDFDMDFESGLNIINRPNGFGKTTIAVFLRVMFYGPDGEKLRSLQNNERRAYRPWNQGAFGGSVTFEKGDKRYILTRFFGNKSSEDTFSLIDAETLMTSSDYSVNIGEELFGIDSDGFRRSIVLHQGSCETQANDSINAKLGNLIAATDDIGSFEEAVESLKKKIDSLSDTRRTGSRYKLKNEIYELENRCMECERLSPEIDSLEKQMEAKGVKVEELTRRQEEFEEKIRKNAENTVLFIRKQDYLKAQDEYDTLNAELDSLEKDYKKKNGKRNFSILPITGILFIIIGLLGTYDFMKCRENITEAGYNASLIFGISTGLGIVLCILFLILRSIYIHGRKTSAGFDKKSLGLLIDDRKRRLETKDAYLTKLEQMPDFEKMMSAREDSISEDYKEEINKLKGEIDEIRKELSGDGIKLYDLKKRFSKEDTVKTELNSKKEQLKKEDRENYLYSNAKLMLEQAKTSFADRYRRPLTENMKKYYNILDDDAQVEYSFDADTNLVAYSSGSFRKPECFSRGMRDLSGFAFRMALADTMYKGEKPFLIMDDPFVNIDDERFAAAVKLLNDISKDYQVIYFTCSVHRIPNI